MKQYFTYADDLQSGPFSIEELIQKNITTNTPVWEQSLPGWMNAGKVTELKEFVFKTPVVQHTSPKVPLYQAPAVKTFFLQRSDLTTFKSLGFLALIILVVSVFSFIVYKKKAHSAHAEITASVPIVVSRQVTREETVAVKGKNPQEIKASIIRKEKQSPSQYLLANTSMHKNLLGVEVFEGTVTNRATTVIYKDIVVQIQFLSKTDGQVGSQRFTISEIVPPRQKAKFKFKTNAPSGTKGFKASVIDASTIE